ncbi:MAG: glycerate kinase [Spirochaetaceae bacterium]|jgi:hydroxypyruvate reductase|nr:glycerate kinase [Spirochaetaceae bacterium]
MIVRMMEERLCRDAYTIINSAIALVMPQAAVRNALANHSFSGAISVLAIGKAAWTMAQAAQEELGSRIKQGIVITKYGHAPKPIDGFEIFEAGHPLSDENTIKATSYALAMAERLGAFDDELLFLISGGGSALFEKPLDCLTLDDLVAVNDQLIKSGANIIEINTIRKRLSQVKGGRFAQLCSPAKVFTVALSDVIGDRLDVIASGPAAPDMTTRADAFAVAHKYHLALKPSFVRCLEKETPKHLDNVEAVITGSVRTLCLSAALEAKKLGYNALVLCTEMDGEASEAGRFIAAHARQIGLSAFSPQRPCALIFGGETIVHRKGSGKGGRNQELVLAASEGIAGMDNTVVFSFGSDGTDGPTDAAGGMVDGNTLSRLSAQGLVVADILARNDAYNGLDAVGALIKTGPTGTNVNDMAVVLCR